MYEDINTTFRNWLKIMNDEIVVLIDENKIRLYRRMQWIYMPSDDFDDGVLKFVCGQPDKK